MIVINLERQTERRDESLRFFRDLGFMHIEVLAATDGQKLVMDGARLRKISKTTWRICYEEYCETAMEYSETTMTSKARVTRCIKPGKLGASGATDLYAQHACCRSHHRAMTRAMELLTFYKRVIIAEDDCVLGNGCSQYQDFGTQLCSKWNALCQQHPGWCALLLGGNNRYDFNTRNLSSLVEGVRCADFVVQGHATLWRSVPRSFALLAEAKRRMDEGLLNDNAVAALMRSHRRNFFWLQPAFIEQNHSFVSNLQLVGETGGQKGYDAALKKRKTRSKKYLAITARRRLPTTVCTAQGSDRRGTKQVNQRALKHQRADFGTKGGKAKTGNGSSAKDVPKKLVSMRRFYQQHGKWPTKKFAAAKWKVSTILWNRGKREIT